MNTQCVPESRQWPGTKCDRCENYGYECSENLMARRSSQKDIDSSRPGSRLIEGYPHAKYFGYHPTISRPLAMHSQTPSVSSIQQPIQYPSPWTGLFDYLRDIDWINLSCSPSSLGSNPFAGLFHSSYSCPVPDLSATPLGKRQMYLEAFSHSQRIIQDPSTALSNISPVDMSIEAIVSRLQEQFPRTAMMYSYEELASICANYVRYGSYWNVFRAALQTDEVLLIDPCYSFDNEMPLTTFESAKHFWLCPELGLKQFCQKLSGLSQMVSDIARTERNSEERAFLAAKIPDRIEEVLGPRTAPPAGHHHSAPYFSPFSQDATSSPVEITDTDIYSPCDSACADGSDDGFSLDGKGYGMVPTPRLTYGVIDIHRRAKVKLEEHGI